MEQKLEFLMESIQKYCVDQIQIWNYIRLILGNIILFIRILENKDIMIIHTNRLKKGFLGIQKTESSENGV